MVWITTLAIASACSDSGMIATTESSSSSTSSTSSSTSSTSTPTTTDAGTGSTTQTPCVTGGCDPSTGTGTGTTDGTGTTEMSSGTTTSTTGTSTGTTGDSTSSTGSTGDSTSSSGSTGGALPCENGALDGDETDVDCGGLVCGPCAIGQLCSENSDCQSMACAGGQCVAPACLGDADCLTECSDGTCDLGTFACVSAPINEGMPCDGGDLCATSKTCQAGACGGGQPKDCAALDTACGTGTCDPGTGDCFTGPDVNKDGLDCDDGNACSAASSCQNGGCSADDPGYLLYEDFADPDPGWQLGESWEIGPAVVSISGGGATGKDPASDHTGSADNRLAGQFIGGLVTGDNVKSGQFNCLTSPAVDTSALPAVWLTFWRHLHSDHTNYAVSRIEVFDGNQWVLLEQGYPAPATSDAMWKEIKFDIGAHKNPAMQVRICNQRNLGAYNYPGWSVDDVTIGPIACTP